jgi:hypothetical protein
MTKPYKPPATPQGRVNVTDPDSKVVKGLRGWLQGYNAQAVSNERHIILAAEVVTAAPDFGHLEPMLDAAQRDCTRPGSRTRLVSCSPMPATGISSRWNGSSTRGSWC